ncbi:MAG: MFS transporter [Gammaproteobacteria bacterium]|nr:MFS transporter [Gammaproteobacteria bacterium]
MTEQSTALSRLEIPVAKQFLIIAVCLLITIVDGFDLLSIAIVAPLVARDWGLDPVELGVVFSSGLAGMGLGALFISPLGDMLGRKSAIIINLLLVAAGMLGAAFSQDIYQLAAARIFAGLGIGAMISNTTSLIMEYVPVKRRTLALGLMMVGNPIGNLSSGVVALFVIERAGWEALFIFGGVVTLALVPAAIFGIPESIDYLVKRKPANALARINQALRFVGERPMLHLPVIPRSEESGTRLTELFGGDLLKRTLLIGAIQFGFMFAYYIYVNWSPKIVSDLSGSDQTAVLISMSTFAGGIGGPLLVGLAVRKLGLTATTSFGFVVIAVGMTTFGLVPSWFMLLAAVSFATGFTIYATQVPLLSLIAGSYPTEVRTSAIGISFAIGRLGSVLGPIVAGFLLDNSAGRTALFAVAALPMFLAALLVRRLPDSQAGRVQG